MLSQVYDLIDELAAEQRSGLVFLDEYGHRRDYTFAEVAAYSQRYAAVLRAFGVHAKELVYVALSTTAKCVFTLLALQRLGAQARFGEASSVEVTTVVSNRKYATEIDASRERFSSEARYLIIGEEREGWARLDTLAQVASPAARIEMQSDDAARSRARADASRLGALPSDRVWCTLQSEDPHWFDRAIVQPWLLGASAVAHNGEFDARERLDLARELDVTILVQTAQEYLAELALPDAQRFKMPRLRRCYALDGGDAALQAQWHERFGMPLEPLLLLT